MGCGSMGEIRVRVCQVDWGESTKSRKVIRIKVVRVKSLGCRSRKSALE